jgi:hypothetical protein
MKSRVVFLLLLTISPAPSPASVIAAIPTVVLIVATKYSFGVFSDLALHGRIFPEELLKVIMLFEESAVVSELRVRLQLCGGLGMLLEKRVKQLELLA